MLTRRDLAVAALSALATLGVATATRSQVPTMGSAVFEWSAIAAQPTKVGEVRRFFDAPTPTLERLELHATTLRRGEAPHPAHRHPDEELVIVKEGTIEAMQNGRTRRVGPGSVIFQASNDEHGMRNVGEGQATYYVLRWSSAATPEAR